LRGSVAFEAFLTSQSKEEFTLKSKEVSKYLKQNVLFEKNFTKKTLDSMSLDPLELLPTTSGHADVKISQILKRHFASVDGQYVQYDAIFDRIEKLSLDYQKYFTRLIAVNKKMKEALLEMQSTAIKFNSVKEVKLKTNLVEDGVYSSVSTYFDNYGRLIREDIRRSEEHNRQQHRRILPLSARILAKRSGLFKLPELCR
jgi:hypothetical protein